jgi:hypothetical protein
MKQEMRDKDTDVAEGEEEAEMGQASTRWWG